MKHDSAGRRPPVKRRRAVQEIRQQVREILDLSDELLEQWHRTLAETAEETAAPDKIRVGRRRPRPARSPRKGMK